jgi:endonuclease/exonuclease/phosphatase family metal-dependent hydrolase
MGRGYRCLLSGLAQLGCVAAERGAVADSSSSDAATSDDDDASPSTDDGSSTVLAEHDSGSSDAPLADVHADERDEIVVLTVNLRTPLTDPGDVDARTERVAALVLELVPDVVALQEVTEGASLANRAEVLADLTGYEFRFAQTHAIVLAEGVGLLSRWPILWDETLELPHVDLLGASTRKVLAAGVDAPHGELVVCSTHMTIDPDETVHADQAVAAWSFVDGHRTAGPAVLAGDTNATPDTLAMRVLRGEAEHAGIVGDLVDAWLATAPDDPGPTFPAEDPAERIDYVYVVPGTRWPATPLSCERHLDTAEEGNYASDHLAVVCRIAFDR